MHCLPPHKGGSSSRRYRLGAYRPAASSERDTLDLARNGAGVESRSAGTLSSGGAFVSRSRVNNKANAADSTTADADDFLASLASAESPSPLHGGGGGNVGGGASGGGGMGGSSTGIGYQSGLPSNKGNGARSNIRGIFDDV